MTNRFLYKAIHTICLLLLGNLLAFSIAAQTTFSEKELTQRLEQLLEVSHVPGFSVAVVKGDKIIYQKGFGYANIEKKQQVDENTLFAIGSTSKAFTTSLLGIMEAEKGLSFNDSPRKYLPTLEFFNNELNNNITITDLVCHRSGLPRHDISWYLFPTESSDSMLARIKYHEPFTGIRTKWYYNNFGYLIQGAITAKLTGRSWEDNIRDRFFVPLEMRRSNLSISELKQMENRAVGYEWKNLQRTEPLDYFNIAAISPAGSINSSASEMSNWLSMWLNAGKYKGQQVLPEAYVAKAMNPLMLVGSGISDPQFPDQHLKSYGYAWFTSSYKGHYRMEHGGNIDGFTANVCLFPADSIGIVVLCNQDGSMVPALARNILSDLLLDLKQDDWIRYHNREIEKLRKQLTVKQSEQPITANPATHPLSDFAGTYNHPGYGTFRLSVKDDSLFAQFPVRRYYMKHVRYDVFEAIEIKQGKVDTLSFLDSKFQFAMNESGDIGSVNIQFEPMLDPIRFGRTPAAIVIDNSKLDLLTGEYKLSDIILTVSRQNDNLLLTIPGQPQYTLIAVKENEYLIQGLTGYKALFNASKSGMELQLIQPNGTYVAQKQNN